MSYNQNNFRQNDFEPKTKNNNYNSNSQKDFYNKNSNYSSNNFHRRNSNNNNVATSGTYTSPNIIRILGGDNQGQNYTTSSSHTIGSQNQNKKDYNKPSTVSSVKRNNQEVNKNSNYQRNLKTNVHSDTRPGLPDKKLKLDEYGKKSAESNSEKTVLFVSKKVKMQLKVELNLIFKRMKMMKKLADIARKSKSRRKNGKESYK